jgi:hypothetical protein
MLLTGNYSDSEKEEDYPEQNVRATYAKAKFARIQPIIQKRTVPMEIEPRPIRTRAGQVITLTHQRLIDLVMNSLQDDEDSGPPDFETDDDDQESVNVIPQFEEMVKNQYLTNLHDVSTYIERMQMDLEFWYQQHNLDSDAHHLNNHMIDLV